MVPIAAERGSEQMSKEYFSAPRHIARVGRSECPRCDDLATHGFRPLPAVVRNGPGGWFTVALKQVTEAVRQRLTGDCLTVSLKAVRRDGRC